MTFPYFFNAAAGDDVGGVHRFHRRLTRDSVDHHESAAPRAAAPIGGVAVVELLRGLRGGDRNALTIVYDTLFEPLWRVAALQLRSGDAAKDAVHDVILWLWEHRADVPVDTDLRVYLATAVRNRARDAGKHQHVVTATEAKVTASPEVSGLGQSAPRTDASAEASDFIEAYQQALTLLSERELTAALLRWEEGYTLDQIAQVLGVSIMGARGIVVRAQTKVQTALQRFR